MTTPFLWGLGSSNNGLLTSLVTLQSTELNSLANLTSVLSSVGGASGKFTNVDTGGAVWGEVFATLGAIGTAVLVGGNISGYFIKSPDSGSTYERSSAIVRAPDFIIPIPNTTITAADQFAAVGKILIP